MNTLYKPSLFQYKQLIFYSSINIIYKTNKYKLSKNFFIKKVYLMHKNNYLFNKIIIHIKFLYLKYRETYIKSSHIIYSNEYINFLKGLGFFQFIKYSNISLKKNDYDIFYLKYNPIIIKINIQNYTKLKVPKHIIIKYLYKYIGMPINYKLIDSSIQYIYKWYINRGFQWVKIKYFYNIQNNQIIISIDEGKIQNIYIKLSHQKNLLSIILKKEFYIINQNIINSYILTNYIARIKDKYNIYYIEYYIQPTAKGLNLIIIYNIYDHKNKTYYIAYIINYSKQYFTNITKYVSTLYYKYKPRKLPFSLSSLSWLNLIHIKPIALLYKYKIFYINHWKKQIIYWIEILILHNIRIIKLNVISTNDKLLNLNKINLLLSFIIKQVNIKQNLSLKDIKIDYMTIYLSKYLYTITCLDIKLQLKNMHLHHLILQNYQFYQKNIKIILYKTVKQIKYNYKISNLQYIKYKLQYYNLNFDTINFFQSNAIMNIKYQLYLYYPNMKNYLINIFQYYLHIIKLQYKQVYSINQLNFLNHNFNIFSEINIFANSLQTSQIVIDYIHYILYNKISTCKYNILYDIEYQIFFNDYNYMYIFINYLPIKTKYLTYAYHQYIKYINHCCKIGTGLHIHIPVTSLPIIRLEAKIIDYSNILFYTYLTPKLYK